MEHYAVLRHEKLLETSTTSQSLLCSGPYNLHECFTKDLSNSLWATRSFRWTTGGSSGPCWKSLGYMEDLKNGFCGLPAFCSASMRGCKETVHALLLPLTRKQCSIHC